MVLMSTLGSLCRQTADWEGFLDVRTALARYVGTIAKNTLGAGHPLAKISSLLVQGDITAEVVFQSIHLLLDSIDQRITGKQVIPNRGFAVTLAKMHEEFAAYCIRSRDAALAQGLPEKSADKASRPTLRRWHGTSGRAISLPGCIKAPQDALDEAELHWLEVIELCRELDPSFNQADPAIDSHWQLGLLLGKTGRLAQSEYHLRKAFKGALKWWGADDADTMCFLERLEDNLAKQGKDTALTALRTRYGHVYQSLQPFYLDSA